MRRPRAGARRYTRPSPLRSDRMWSLPISPAAAYILLINSLRRERGSVDSWIECWSGASVRAPLAVHVHTYIYSPVDDARARARESTTARRGSGDEAERNRQLGCNHRCRPRSRVVQYGPLQSLDSQLQASSSVAARAPSPLWRPAVPLHQSGRSLRPSRTR